MKKSKRAVTVDIVAPYLFILPFILSFIIFFLFPACYSLFLSFHSYKGYGAARFVGLDNFISLLTYNSFWLGVRNTLGYWLAHLAPVMLLSFSAAYIINRRTLGRANAFIKPIVFMPQMAPIVASALIWRVIFGTNVGVINQLFGTSIPFMEYDQFTRICIVVVVLWRDIGWFMVIYLAGLTSINEEILEAAKIDGAVGWQSLYYIVLPLMKPIFEFAFIMDTIGSLKLFTEPNVLMAGRTLNPSIAPVMNILVINMNGGSFGMAAATGWLLFGLIMAFVAIQSLVFKRGSD